MSLIQRVESDLMAAMKARAQLTVDTLRMLRAALKNEQIALGHELTDEEALKILQRQMKQRKEAADQYRQGDRAEAAVKEDTEAKILEAYLPAQLSDEALTAIIQKIITETGAAGAADFGKVMGPVMREVAGQADGTRVTALVKQHLG